LGYQIINYASTIFFILDIVLQLNTTFYDSDGEEVYNKRRIRTNYLRGMFSIDLVSSIPIELLVDTVSII
jgi:hypothetical protein